MSRSNGEGGAVASTQEPDRWEPRKWQPQEWSLGQDWKPTSWNTDPMPTTTDSAPESPAPAEPTPPAPTRRPAQAKPPPATATKPAPQTGSPPAAGQSRPAPAQAAPATQARQVTRRAPAGHARPEPTRPTPSPTLKSQPPLPAEPRPVRPPQKPRSPHGAQPGSHGAQPRSAAAVPPSNWLPSAPSQGESPPAPRRKNTGLLIFVVIAVVIFFGVGQLISSWTPIDPLDDFEEEWGPGPEEAGYLDLPGSYHDEVTIGLAWLPVPADWDHKLTSTEDGGEYLVLVPLSSPQSQLRFAWEPNSVFLNVSELCDSTTTALTADVTEATFQGGDEVFYGYTDVEAAVCSASVGEGEASIDHRVTAFLDPFSSTSTVVISEHRGEEPLNDEFETWRRYLTCSVADQLGTVLDDCIEGT